MSIEPEVAYAIAKDVGRDAEGIASVLVTFILFALMASHTLRRGAARAVSRACRNDRGWIWYGLWLFMLGMGHNSLRYLSGSRSAEPGDCVMTISAFAVVLYVLSRSSVHFSRSAPS